MTNKKKLRLTITSCLLLAALSVSVYAYRVDYVHSTLATSNNTYVDGGLYISEEPEGFYAMADTSVGTFPSNATQALLRARVTLNPYRDDLEDQKSYVNATTVQATILDTDLVYTVNAISASGEHMVRVDLDTGSHRGWSDSTSWHK